MENFLTILYILFLFICVVFVLFYMVSTFIKEIKFLYNVRKNRIQADTAIIREKYIRIFLYILPLVIIGISFFNVNFNLDPIVVPTIFILLFVLFFHIYIGYRGRKQFYSKDFVIRLIKLIEKGEYKNINELIVLILTNKTYLVKYERPIRVGKSDFFLDVKLKQIRNSSTKYILIEKKYVIIYINTTNSFFDYVDINTLLNKYKYIIIILSGEKKSKYEDFISNLDDLTKEKIVFIEK